jgi:uncharacterized protein YktA (UPF0223 family)
MTFLFSNQEFKKLIIDLNTKSQLYQQGIDSEGIKLSEYSRNNGYSNYTKAIKEAKGQPTNRITLNDTGAFYRSFRTKLFGSEIVIFANPNKDDTNLYDEWGTDIVGLTDESLKTLAQFAKILIKPYVKKTLQK